MSLEEVLQAYEAPEVCDSMKVPDMVPIPVTSNPHLDVSYPPPWEQSLMTSYSGTCRRAFFANGFHVFLCLRRIYLVDKLGRHISFPPFDADVFDAYVTSERANTILIILGLSTGVQIVLMSVDGHTEVIDSVLLTTHLAVERVHSTTADTYALCFSDCSVDHLFVSTDDDGMSLHASLPRSPSVLRKAVASIFASKKYKHSCFNKISGYLLVLSEREIVAWEYAKGIGMERVARAELSRFGGAVAVLPLTSPDRRAVATVVMRSGDRVDLGLIKGKSGATIFVLLRPRCLHNAVAIPAVALACGGPNTSLMYDDKTSSLVTITEASPFVPGGAPNTEMASLVNLNARVCGLGYEQGQGTMDSDLFWVYGSNCIVARVEYLKCGQLLQESFDNSRRAVELLRQLNPVLEAEVLMDVPEGASHEELCELWDGILTPTHLPRDSTEVVTYRVSPGAIGFANRILARLRMMDRLCNSFHHVTLADSLVRAREDALRLYRLCLVIFNQGGWLDRPDSQMIQWGPSFTMQQSSSLSHSALGARSSVSTLRAAINAQAEFLAKLLNAVRQASVVCGLYSLLLRESRNPPMFPGKLEDYVWGDASAAPLEYKFSMELLELHSMRAVTQLEQEMELLPPKAQLVVQLHAYVSREEYQKALDFALDHMGDVVRSGLFQYTAALLEAHVPQLLPTLKMMLRHYRLDPSIATDLLASLELMSDTDLLRESLVCIFEDSGVRLLHASVIEWMENHSLDDSRIMIFADVIASVQVGVNSAHSLTSRFFSCCCLEVQGERFTAARRFGELACTPTRLSLDARFVCIDRAMRHEPVDADKLTQFVLLLQEQLAHLVRQFSKNEASATLMDSGQERQVQLMYSSAQICADLDLLTQHYLDEKQLFEVAGRWREIGGASIQLDILKIHSDSPEEVTSDVVVGVLAFLKAAGIPATEAVERVLKEYLPIFQGPFPLYPFLEFLEFEGHTAKDIAMLFLDFGVDPVAVFDTFLSLIDGRRNTLFPVTATIAALTAIVEHLTGDRQQKCTAHVLECIRGILAGEYRNIFLTEAEVATLKEVESSLKVMLRRLS